MGKKIEELEREKIFMPFDALKGFRQALSEKELPNEQKIGLSEETQNELTQTLLSVKKRDLVRVKYYNNQHYLNIQGSVEQVDFIFKHIIIDGQKILFENILEIQIV